MDKIARIALVRLRNDGRWKRKCVKPGKVLNCLQGRIAAGLHGHYREGGSRRSNLGSGMFTAIVSSTGISS